MLAIERLNRIRIIIQEYSHIDVSTLSSLLSVTETTIRKDLEKLEKEGFVTRIHGGAKINEKNVDHNSFQFLTSVSTAFKKIGNIARQLINENDVIFLGGGEICHYIAQKIKDENNLSIVTNNFGAIFELSGLDNINLISTGGIVERSGDNIQFIGDFASKTLENIFINKAFITVDGIHMHNGLTISNANLASLYQSVIDIAEELIIVVDYSKFEKTSMIKFADFERVQKVITNENIPDIYKKMLFENNIQLYTTVDSDIRIEE